MKMCVCVQVHKYLYGAVKWECLFQSTINDYDHRQCTFSCFSSHIFDVKVLSSICSILISSVPAMRRRNYVLKSVKNTMTVSC